MRKWQGLSNASVPSDFLGRGRNASSDQKTMAEASQKRKKDFKEWMGGTGGKTAQRTPPPTLQIWGSSKEACISTLWRRRSSPTNKEHTQGPGKGNSPTLGEGVVFTAHDPLQGLLPARVLLGRRPSPHRAGNLKWKKKRHLTKTQLSSGLFKPHLNWAPSLGLDLKSKKNPAKSV